MATDTQTQYIGESAAMKDHDHDLVHELSKRLDAYWRYDQCIANASRDGEKQEFWRQLKKQDNENIRKLRQLIKREIENDCF